MRAMLFGLTATFIWAVPAGLNKFVLEPAVSSDAHPPVRAFPGFNCGPGTGDCCVYNGTPGCEDENCCNEVCIVNPYCCDTMWDDECVRDADDLCGELCHPPLCPPDAVGDCCDANNGLGCGDEDCCNAVCTEDPYCCTDEWDINCAETAVDYPVECACGLAPVACCLVDGGCQDLFDHECTDLGGVPLAEGTECLQDGDLNGIDDACESICPTPADNPCCEPWVVVLPGCEDPECCRMVCLADPECCNNLWDGICVDLALELCPICQPPICPLDADGDCCLANGTPGCDNDICCELVCQGEWTCCDPNYSWDSVCVSAAEFYCQALCDCTSFGDVDGNGFWNTEDYTRFNECLTGPDVPYSGLDCLCADEAGDGHVSLDDVAAFLNLFSAP